MSSMTLEQWLGRNWPAHRQVLRWAGFILPFLFIVLLESFEDYILAPLIGQLASHLTSLAILAGGAALFSYLIFRFTEQVENRLRRQNQDLAALNDLSRIMSGTLALDQLLNRTLERVLEVTGSDAGEIFLLDESRSKLILALRQGVGLDLAATTSPIAIGEGLPGLVAQQMTPIVISDLAGDPRCTRPQLVEQGFRSMVSVPLLAKDQVVGVMAVAARSQTFTPADVDLLTAIGNQIGVAVESSQLHARSEQQARYLSTLIESSGNAIITTSAKGEIQSWNRAAELIYGWQREEAMGQTLPMVPKHLLGQTYGLTDRLLHKRETIHNFETERLRKDGDLIPVMVTASPLQNRSGEVVGLLGISTDMREKKKLEQELFQQQRALAVVKERERLARELHDGLGQVLGYINTQSQATQELLESGRADQAGILLTRLIEVVQAAHTEVREHILGLHATDLLDQGLVTTLKEFIRRFNEFSTTQAQLTIAEEVTCMNMGPNQEAQLMRIIQEALANVRKHAQTDQVLVNLDGEDDQLCVTIEDRGCGFDMQQLSAKNRHRFGLEIMRERSAEIGATFQIQSSVGHGTRVTVQIPCGAKGQPE